METWPEALRYRGASARFFAGMRIWVVPRKVCLSSPTAGMEGVFFSEEVFMERKQEFIHIIRKSRSVRKIEKI